MLLLLLQCVFLITAYRTDSADVIQWIRLNEHVQMCSNVTFIVNCKDHTDAMCSNFLPNVGDECFSILTHVTKTYEIPRQVPREILFHIPASFLKSEERKNHVNALLNKVLKEKKGIITYEDMGHHYDFENDANFVMHRWKGSTHTEPINLIHAKIEPYKEWYRHYFGDTFPDKISWSLGTFAIDTKQIQKYPLSLYEELLEETKMSIGVEVCHYLERTWMPMWS